MAGTIEVSLERVSAVALKMQVLAETSGDWTAFSVDLSDNRGPQAQALERLASLVGVVAVKQQEMIGRIVNEMVKDAMALQGLDEAMARELLLGRSDR